MAKQMIPGVTKIPPADSRPARSARSAAYLLVLLRGSVRRLDVPLCGVFALALLLRLYIIDRQGLWMDEVYSVDMAKRGISAILTDRFGLLGNQPPLYYLLVWTSLLPADPVVTPVFVRLISTLSGALLPLVTYGLGRATFGRSHGLLAALLVALAPTMLDYSQDARPYALVALLTAAAAYYLLRAVRDGGALRWAGFALCASGCVLLSYTAVVLVLPSLVLLALWGTWRIWADTTKRRHALFSLGLLALVSCMQLADILSHAVRNAPSASPSLPSLVLGVGSGVLTWLTRAGLPETSESVIGLVFVLLALLGAYAGMRRAGQDRVGAYTCLLMLVLPIVTLAWLSTSSPIYERYLLFIAPFYFLLVSNGLLALLDVVRAGAEATGPQLWAAWLPAVLAVLLFLVGAYIFLTPDGHAGLSYRPDYRAAARYLSQHAHPGDTIIFMDTPVHGLTTSNFYWRGLPPAPAYDAIDPRLYAAQARGDIYWVVGGFGEHALSEAAPDGGWKETTAFERVIVLREGAPAEGLTTRVDSFTASLESLFPDYKPLKSLRGTIAQAQGDVAGAVRAYSESSFFPLGIEYQRTAEGFAARGMETRAWQEAMMSKHDQPERPEIHTWLAEQLDKAGLSREAAIEEQIALRLEGR